MKLIIGLGNPGKKYEQTRHNTGWMVLDELFKKNKWRENQKLKALVCETVINDQDVVLLKPQTFMNNSGVSAMLAKQKYPKLENKDIIVVHDDKDIPLGEVKTQFNRGSAGHNGVKSLIEKLGGKDFYRVRVGIAPSDFEEETDRFVMGKFTSEEKKKLQKVSRIAAEKISQLV